MQAPFSSSLRALAAERGRGLELALVLVLALLLAWGGWMARAEVVLVEVSVRASIESVAAAVPVTTLVEGRVDEVQLRRRQVDPRRPALRPARTHQRPAAHGRPRPSSPRTRPSDHCPVRVDIRL